ncbi:MAG: serine protease [Cyclobacteriaceae bacterium]
MNKEDKNNRLIKPLTPRPSQDPGFWGKIQTVNPDTNRLFEAIIGENNFVGVQWLYNAVEASKKVGQVIKNGRVSGTTFLVDQNLALTNNHIFEDVKQATNSYARFDYIDDPNANQIKFKRWKFLPDKFFQTNEKLDYSLVFIETLEEDGEEGNRGFLRLTDQYQNPEINGSINIIQHPRGEALQIVFRDNQLKKVTDNVLAYLTDTEYGSSGSPVFDDRFQVIGIHSHRKKDPNSDATDGTQWYRNVGFRMDKIYSEIEEFLSYNQRKR